MTQYYVAESDGNNSYNGLYPSFQGGSNGPWAHPNYAIRQVSPGDLIDVRIGTYNTALRFDTDVASGSEGSPITLRNYQDEMVTINAPDDYAMYSAGAYPDYWIVDGLILQRTTTGLTTVLGSWGDSEGLNYWIVRNCTIYGTFQLNGHDLLFENNEVDGTLNDGENGAGVEIPCETGKNLSYNNIYRGNTIHDWTTRGIWLQGRNHDDIIEDNIIYNIGDICIDADGATKCQWDHIIRDNLIYAGGEQGIELENCYNCLVERNTVYDTTIQQITVINYDTGEIGGDNNEYGVAGDHRGLQTLNVVRDNLVRDGTGIGIAVFDAGGVSLLFNTCYANGTNVYLKASGGDYYNGLNMQGNILSQAIDAEISVEDIAEIDTDNYNILDPARAYIIEKRDAPYTTYTLAQYRSATGNAAQSVEADPLFTNAASDDYTLRSLSPAINLVPLGLTNHTKDLAGNPRGQGTMEDAGCYETIKEGKMRGRNVNVQINNWQNLGTTAPVPKWSVDIAIEWTKGDGTPGAHSGTYIFPNVLSSIPLKRIRQYMEEIILREARIQLGIDEEE